MVVSHLCGCAKATPSCPGWRRFGTPRLVGDQRSTINLLKTYGPTERPLIQTRRGEIDYGDKHLHGYAKWSFVTR